MFPNRKVLKDETTESIAVGTGQLVTIPVPNGQAWKIKTIDLAPGSNSTVTKVEIDGQDTGLTGASNDIISEFGEAPYAQREIRITVDNSGISAENITITIKGIFYSN